jgi:phosphoglycolate phosphatase
MLSSYRHIIWDWNGTLLNDVELTCTVLNESLRKWKLPEITVEEFRRRFCFPLSRFYKEIGFPSEEIIASAMKEWFISYENRIDECPLHNDALTILQANKKAGKSQSILSAHDHDALIAVIEKRQLGRYFENVLGVTGANRGMSKVALAKGHMQGLREQGIPANEVVIIGDSNHDYEVAKELSIDCILVAQGVIDRERLERLGVPVIGSLAHLL